MKKIINLILVALIIFNFVFCNSAYAADDTSFVDDIDSKSITPKDLESLVNDNKANYNDEEVPLFDMQTIKQSLLFGNIAGLLTSFFNLFPALIVLTMKICLEGETFTIEKAVFNRIPMFSIDYFNFDSTYTVGSLTTTVNHKNSNGQDEVVDIKPKTLENANLILKLRESVAKYYTILRLISIAISLLVLIYVGIRMALSTISEDKAKYKKMLIAWVESIILLFLMHYIISFTLALGRLFSNIMYDILNVMSANNKLSFETETLSIVLSFAFSYAGWTYAAYSVAFWILVYVQTKFFIMYLRRVVTVGFLIFISPLITVIYPIDKVGDGKSQSFIVWLNELMINVFIQPIQAIIYFVFMFTAGEIAKYSIWVAIVFLLMLTKAEKIVLQLFNLRNVASLRPVDEERKK